MDFDYRFKHLFNEAEKLCKAYEEARDFTQNFLDCCKNNGIDLVAIGVLTDKIPESVRFPFGAQRNALANKRDESGLPAIWQAARDAGVHGGCGNSSQVQLDPLATEMLIDGVYELQDGAWKRV